MFREMFWLILFSLLLITPIFAQKLGPAKLIPKPLTEKQQVLLNEGVKLHDNQQFDKAIVKYGAILSENPDSPAALY